MILYEVNIIPKFNVHIFVLLGEIFVYGLILFLLLAFYVTSSIKSKDEVLIEDGFLNLLEIESYINLFNVFLALCIFSYPFKLISFLTYFESFQFLNVYYNVVFKLSPSLLLGIIVMIINWFSFSFILHILFGDKNEILSNVLNCITYLPSFILNLNLLKNDSNYYNSNYQFFAIFIIFFIIIFIIQFMIIIANIVMNYKKCFELETSYINPLSLELKLIQDKIDSINEKEKEDINEIQVLQKHQILWLNFSSDYKTFHHYYNIYSNDNYLTITYFVNSQQIIAFTKYLFSIKPNLLHMYIEKKFTILINIELKNKQIPEENISEIESLVNWLNYIKSRINLIFLINGNLNKKSRYNLKMSYENSKIIMNEKVKSLIYSDYSCYELNNLLKSISEKFQIHLKEKHQHKKATSYQDGKDYNDGKELLDIKE